METTAFLLMRIVADNGLPAISGGAGWVGASMLGAVLSWLMFKYLPDKDRQLEALLTSRDRLLSEQLDRERQASDNRLAQLLQEVQQGRAQFWELIKKVAGIPLSPVPPRPPGEKIKETS